MDYVICQECPCCSGKDLKTSHTAILLRDPEGEEIYFESKESALKFIRSVDESGHVIPNIMIIPAVEMI
tara:strand:+ start:312 stop:518 length:207 start_codon:yes stop_codon:yes gene_type:complete